MTNHNQDLMSSNTNVIVSIGILYETLMDIAQSYQPLADNIHYDDIKIKAVSNIIDGLITNLLNQTISDQGGWPLNGALNPPGKQDYNYNAGLSQMIALASRELFNGNIEIAGSVIAVVDNRVCEHMAPYIPEPNTTNCVLLCGYHFSLANCVVLNVKRYSNAQETVCSTNDDKRHVLPGYIWFEQESKENIKRDILDTSFYRSLYPEDFMDFKFSNSSV